MPRFRSGSLLDGVLVRNESLPVNLTLADNTHSISSD